MRRLVVGLMFVSGSLAWAEVPDEAVLPVTIGSKVRVQLGAGTEISGVLAAVNEHVLTLATDGGPARIPLESISVAEMKVGRRGHAKKGAIIGALFGLLLQAVPIDPQGCDGRISNGGAEFFCSRGTALMLIPGAAAEGALIGHFIKSDVWARVDLSAGVVQGRAGPGVAVRLRF